MYISLFTLIVITAIVVFCWFRKPAKTAATAASEVIEVGADILHSGLSQLRDQVEVAAITSSVKNTMEVLTILQENKEIIEKGVTVHSLYCGLRATQADIMTDSKGKALTERQKVAVCKAQIMNIISTKPETQPQPTVQTTQPTQVDADAEVFTL